MVSQSARSPICGAVQSWIKHIIIPYHITSHTHIYIYILYIISYHIISYHIVSTFGFYGESWIGEKFGSFVGATQTFTSWLRETTNFWSCRFHTVQYILHLDTYLTMKFNGPIHLTLRSYKNIENYTDIIDIIETLETHADILYVITMHITNILLYYWCTGMTLVSTLSTQLRPGVKSWW